MTLTETAEFTKKSMIFVLIFLFLLVAAWGGYIYYKRFIYVPPPTPEILPDIFFGKLPALKISEASGSAGTYAFSLDTETGSLPVNTPKIIKVYPIASLGTDLLALERSKNLASKLGFIRGPEALSTTQYLFLDKHDGEMVVNLDTGNFKFTHRESTQSSELVKTDGFTDPQTLSRDFKNFLLTNELLKEQLKEGRTKVVYEKNSKDESSFATVFLWQDDVEKTPIVTEKFTEGLIKGIVNKSRDRDQRFLILDYTFWPIDLLSGHTYPIITPDEAYDKLQTQQAKIIVKPLNIRVSITKVYLGYYLSKEYQPFLQPVYVFEGDNFVAYVPAVKEDQIE